MLAERGRAPERGSGKPLPEALRHIRSSLQARASAQAGGTSLAAVVTLICEAFAQFDLDCNGTLSWDEFEQAVRSLPGCDELSQEVGLRVTAAVSGRGKGLGGGGALLREAKGPANLTRGGTRPGAPRSL